MSAQPQSRPRSRLRRLVGHPLLHPFNDVSAIDDLLGGVNRLWSLRETRARVVEVVDETADTRTFVLKPNRHWRGAQPGQHVVIEVEIDGVRRQRAFSLSAPAARGALLRLTVKRQPNGHVTNWMHDHLRPRAVVGISAAAGDFVLPEPLPARLLMLGAGSGITPINAMLQALHARGWDGDVVLLHDSRRADDSIFGDSLQALASQWPALRRIAHHSEASGLLDVATLTTLVPDHLERLTLMCGPAGLMAWMQAHYAAHGAAARLMSERFGLPRRVVDAGEASAQVQWVRTGTGHTTAGDQTLLAAAEAAGLTPRYGCRMVICRPCQGRKRSGTVQNLLTGAVSCAPGEIIQLCISAARSDLELEL